MFQYARKSKSCWKLKALAPPQLKIPIAVNMVRAPVCRIPGPLGGWFAVRGSRRSGVRGPRFVDRPQLAVDDFAPSPSTKRFGQLYLYIDFSDAMVFVANVVASRESASTHCLQTRWPADGTCSSVTKLGSSSSDALEGVSTLLARERVYT